MEGGHGSGLSFPEAFQVYHHGAIHNGRVGFSVVVRAGAFAGGSRHESEIFMKKNEGARKAQALRLNRETLLKLEKGELEAVGGGVEARSVKFCTEACTTTGGIS